MSTSADADKGRADPSPVKVATDVEVPAAEQQGGERAEAGPTNFVELPAPEGWKKKLMTRTDGAPKRNEIVFVSPTGEEIRNKRQLASYLKSHPGGPSASQFVWSTGVTVRRSARISEKAKVSESLEEPPQKRPKKWSSANISDEKKVSRDEELEEAQGEETELTVDGTKQNVEDEKVDDLLEIGGSEKVADEVTAIEDSAQLGPEEKISGAREKTEEQKEHPELEDTNKTIPAEGEPKDNLLVQEKVQQAKDAEGAGVVQDKAEKQTDDTLKKIVTENNLENAEEKKREYSFEENIAGKDHELLMAALREGDGETVKVSGANGTISNIYNTGTD